MIRHVLLPLLFVGSGQLLAQLTGHVEVPALGFAFDIPVGWQGAEQDGTWGLVSDDVPGTIILTTHEHNDLIALERDMRNVASDDPANQLSVIGPPGHPLPHAVMLDFSGTMEWQPVTLRGIGSISDAGGPGTSVIALAQGTALPPVLSDAALALMRSMRYSRPVIPAVVEQWRSHLTSTRLTYLASYSSSTGTEGSPGGGMSSTRTLDLCPGGWYTLSYGADLVLGGNNVSAASSAKGTENGSWDVFTDSTAGARLELRASDGTIRSYGLSDRQGGTYLNGERWFRTTPSDGENAPQCAP